MSLRQKYNSTKQFIRGLLPLQEIPQHVFIVGAQKAGTTALHAYLINHPMIFGGDRKELGFFSRDRLFDKGLKSYRAMYPISFSGSHALDATPEYLYYKRSVERIYNYRPDSKIIVLLREPVDRAYSAFNMYQQSIQQRWFKRRIQYANDDAKAFFLPLIEGKVRPEVEYFLEREMEIIGSNSEEEEPALIRRGIYAPQIERYIRNFGRENLIVVFSNDLRSNPDKVVKELFEFIGIPQISGLEYPLRNVRDYAENSGVREKILRSAGHYFDNDKRALSNDLGIQVPW